jgi:hypothetical protein
MRWYHLQPDALLRSYIHLLHLQGATMKLGIILKAVTTTLRKPVPDLPQERVDAIEVFGCREGYRPRFRGFPR